MGGKLSRPGYLHPRGQAAQRQLHPRGGQAAQGGGQDTLGYLHPRGGKLPRGSFTPGGASCPGCKINRYTVCKNRFEKSARIFSRRHKQTTFSDAVFLGSLRVTVIFSQSIYLITLFLGRHSRLCRHYENKPIHMY